MNDTGGSFHQFARRSGVYLLGTVGARLVSLLLLPLNTHYLETAEYGDYELLMILASLALPTATLTLSSAIYRFMLVEDDLLRLRQINTNVWVAAFISIAFHAALILGITTLIGSRYGLILTLLVASQSLTAVAQPMLRGLKLNGLFAASGVILTFTQGFFNIALLLLTDLRADALLLAVVIANVIVTVFCFTASRSWRYWDLSCFSITVVQEYLRFTLPLIPAAIISWLNAGSGRVVLGMTHGTGAVGYLATASRFGSISSAFYSVLNLSTNDGVIADDGRAQSSSSGPGLFTRVFAPLASLITSALLVLIPLSLLAFRWLVDQKYAEASIAIPIVLVTAAATAIADLYLSVFLSQKATRAILTSTSMAAVVNVGLSIALIPSLGFVGAAIAALASSHAMLLYRHLLCLKLVPVPLSPRLLMSLLSVVTVVAVCYLIPSAVIGVGVVGLITFLILNREVLGRVVGQARP